MVQNFADLVDSYGHAPNGARSYYLTRSQPPFFFAMVGLLSPTDPAAAFARYLPQLKTEYAFWMEGERELTMGGGHRLYCMSSGVAPVLGNLGADDYRDHRDLSCRSNFIPKVAITFPVRNAG